MIDNQLLNTIGAIAVTFLLKIVSGLILLWIGLKLIDWGVSLLKRLLRGRPIDATIINYITSIVGVTLKIILTISILGFFGIETTSFAALLAALGIAIGAAWSGLLANFAAGAFLIIFRPFKVGDFISAGGVTGTVKEIGLFTTTLDTLDNVQTIIGNNKIFADNIQNFTANPYRRVDLVAQLNHGVDHKVAIALLKRELSKVPNVLTDPAPDVEILEFNLAGPVLAVRPYCHNDHYWQVYFDTNRIIRDSFGEAGYPAPEQHYAIRQG